MTPIQLTRSEAQASEISTVRTRRRGRFFFCEIFENLRKNGDRLNRYNDREAGSVSCEARTSRSKETSGLHW